MEDAPKQMTYAEALKQVSVPKKDKENFLLIQISYDSKLLMPYAAGLQLLQSLSLAEKLHEGYSEQIRIGSFDRNSVTTTILSSEEYSQIKIAELLQVRLEDVQKMKLAA